MQAVQDVARSMDFVHVRKPLEDFERRGCVRSTLYFKRLLWLLFGEEAIKRM